MPHLAEEGLVIRAVSVAKCKVFRPGDLVTLCGREILTGHFNTYCAVQINQIVPLLLAMERGLDVSELGLDLHQGIFFCKGPNCEGRFECNRVPMDELAVIRGAAALVTSPPPAEAPAPQPAETEAHAAEALEAPTYEAPIPSPPASRLSDAAVGVDKEKPFLEQLPPQLVERLLDAGKRQMLGAKETILEQGQAGHAVYFIEKGEVAVEKLMQNGSHVLLAKLGAGEAFGEMALLSGDPVSATVRTTIKTRLVALSGDQLDKVMAENPQLHRWFSHLFAERLRATNVRLEEQLSRGMTGRLSMISLLDLLQTLLMARKTGVLNVRRGNQSGTLYIKGGQVQSALAGEMAEEAAFVEMCRWTDGSFSFQEGETTSLPINIHRDTMHIMMDAARQTDEEGT